MACNTSLTSITKSCANNTGGITNVYFIPSEFVSATTVTAGTITAITLSGSEKFKEYQFNKNTANLVEAAPTDISLGSKVYSYTLTLKLARREVAKRNALAQISAGARDLKIICKDGNGLYWFMGYANSANLTDQSGGFGVAKAEGSQYDLTFLAEEPDEIYEVSPSIIAAIVA